jgi:ABC-2 type transport system permease protein
MTQYAKRLLGSVGAVFRGDDRDDAWIDSIDHLTPRELRLRRMVRYLQWGALVNGVLGLLLLLLLLAGNSQSLQSVLLLSFDAAGNSAEVGLLLAILGVFTNMTTFLLLSVGTLAQEIWALIVLLVVLLANAAALLVVGFTPAILALLPALYIGFLALRDLGAFHGNPVTSKELRGRMRGVRAFAIITVFLLLMGSFTVLLYLLQLPNIVGERTISPGQLGRQLFRGIVGIEMLLVIFIVPALTSGAITGERERKTYDLLQTTLLPAPTFLVGKMESSLGYIVLLLLSAIPLQSIAFLFGGVSEAEVILAFTILIFTALVLGALGLFFSARTDRTLTSTVRVYTLAAVLTVGLPLLSLLLFQGAFSNAISGVAAVPAASSALTEASIIYADMFANSLNPITAATYTQQILIDYQQVFVLDVQLATDGSTIPLISPWLLLVISYGAIAALLLLVAVRRMRRSKN